MSDKFEGINGRVNITREGDSYRFEWQGGDVIGISNDLIADAIPELLSVEGDIVTLGPFQAKITKRLDDMVVACRIKVNDE